MSSVPPDSPSSESSMATSSSGSLSVLDYDVEQALSHMSVPELYEYGLNLISEKRLEEALRVFTAVVQESPDKFEAYRARGDCHLELLNYGKAISDYRRATELHPGATSDHQRSVAHFYLHLFAKLECESPSSPSSRSVPSSECSGLSLVAWKHYNRALSSYYLNQYDQAIEDFSLVLRDFPEFAAGFRCRGTAHLHKGDFSKAIEDLMKSSQLESSSSTTFYNLALAHGNLQQFHAAVKYFTQSIALNPHDATTYSNRGISYKSLAQFDSAIADFSTALSLNPDSASALDHRAQCYAELQNHTAAVNDFTKSIDIQPTAPRFQRRANAHFALKNVKAAIKDVDSALASTKAAKELAQLFLTRGRFQLDADLKQAEEDFGKCLQYEPNTIEALFQRSAARYIMKDYKGAKEDLARASPLTGNDALRSELHSHLTMF